MVEYTDRAERSEEVGGGVWLGGCRRLTVLKRTREGRGGKMKKKRRKEMKPGA